MGGDDSNKKSPMNTEVITIGNQRAIYLQNFRVPSDSLHRPEDALLQREQRGSVQEQQNKFHYSAAKRHPIEFTFRER